MVVLSRLDILALQGLLTFLNPDVVCLSMIENNKQHNIDPPPLSLPATDSSGIITSETVHVTNLLDLSRAMTSKVVRDGDHGFLPYTLVMQTNQP